ncbi:leucine--tRNA ligase [Candidatus Saccharibacteria bacterium]|nr:leucine--tRNA ligase [Candidatus Saccharibacteria bacterium]
MDRYEPLKIEEKWQKIWEKEKPYKAEIKDGVPKKYIAEMFPYPSGAGLHVGHVRNFTIVDVLTRFYEQQRLNVMRPFGYDTFGLPAENYAIKTGMAPQEVTRINIDNFRKQAKRLGYAIDWDREINTSSPEYYKWTQWCFLQLYKKGLAYQKESYQWWCPEDQTVLANEQVENGKCWRCGHEVEKKKMKQWFFKITEYADELLDEIDALDWPDKIKTMQKNWIGRSVGAEIEFEVAGVAFRETVSREGHDLSEVTEPRNGGREGARSREKQSSYHRIKVFTTRPDTIFGATFIVVAPEYPGLEYIVSDDAREEVEAYSRAALLKSEIERQENKEKTGVFTGAYAINPATKEKIPIWVADYVLSGYGTGAIMAVPAMDERDKEFAEAHDLPIVETELCEFGQFGTPKTTYKMRDWLISRQRYWGCPIPIAYDKDGNPYPIPEDQLPVLIPEVEDYKPDHTGRSALAKAKDWLKVEIPVKDSKTGEIHMEEMTRETDTLDGYACSSWYLWRYVSPHDAEHAWNPEAIKYWAPTDIYVGADHAVAHLLYIRFWCKFFADEGYLPFREPIKELIYHGYINAPDGKKMSKSKGNVIDPLDVINDGYGADTLRTYEMFIGPVELDAAWDPRSVGGVYRFLNRCYNLCFGSESGGASSEGHPQSLRGRSDEPREDGREERPEEDGSTDSRIIRHKTIKKVTEDIYKCQFNTAVAALMEYVNELYKVGASEEDLIVLAKLLKPFAPHLASEMLEKLDADDEWPKWDEKYLIDETVEVVVQINGKLRAKLTVNLDELEDENRIIEMALADKKVKKYTNDGIKKTIFVKKARLLNIVV